MNWSYAKQFVSVQYFFTVFYKCFLQIKSIQYLPWELVYDLGVGQ